MILLYFSEKGTIDLSMLCILYHIFGFGLFSVGGAGRSLDGPSVSQSELTGGMCFLMFTAGDESKLSCVQRSACNDIDTFQAYSDAGKMWYKMAKLLNVPFADKYTDVLNAISEASEHGAQGGNCAKYNW